MLFRSLGFNSTSNFIFSSFAFLTYFSKETILPVNPWSLILSGGQDLSEDIDTISQEERKKSKLLISSLVVVSISSIVVNGFDCLCGI